MLYTAGKCCMVFGIVAVVAAGMLGADSDAWTPLLLLSGVLMTCGGTLVWLDSQ